MHVPHTQMTRTPEEPKVPVEMKVLGRCDGQTSLLFHHSVSTASPQYLHFLLPTQHAPNAPRILAPLLLRFPGALPLPPPLLLLSQQQHARVKSPPDGHGARADRAEQDDAGGPSGEGAGGEAEDAEEDAEMGAGGVRVVREAVERRARRAYVRAYEGGERAWVQRDRCADGDAPW